MAVEWARGFRLSGLSIGLAMYFSSGASALLIPVPDARAPRVALVGWIPVAMSTEPRRASYVDGCTPTPALYAKWKAATQWPQATDSAVGQLVEQHRDSVTFDPFDAPIAAGGAIGMRGTERILWEDDSVIVIVAKPATPRDALVIPKREMMFPTDAGPALLQRLALVAAATSDAFIQAAGMQCHDTLVATISIGRPGGLMVRHLHVHVQPPAAIAFHDEATFYSRMSQHLAQRLSKRNGANGGS
jgi:diadenosine tetraphosphate (Ap4A) HIT family hydrolase